MSILKEIIHNVSRVLTYTVYIISMYYLCVSFFGILRKKNIEKVKPKRSFALIVAAHNEEVVIDDIIESLKGLDYPKKLYDIFVIADNCTDNTALKARKKGVFVYERKTIGKRGKGYALEWMFNKIFKMEKKYDDVAIFDADNLVHKNFLKEMNKQLCKGYKVVQGYLDSKNPGDTWITGSYSIAFWTNNRMFQLARSNLGLSAQLGGTGFSIDTDILKKLGWGATCLTEDLEFTCKLILHGYKVGWAHDAIIYDEKPLTLLQSWNQRKRWMQGFTDVSSRYFFKLVKESIRNCNFLLMDCALYSIQPIIAVLIGISAVSGGVQYIMKTFNLISNFNTIVYSINFDLFTISMILISILQFVYTPFILILEKKLNFKTFLYYIIYPVYAFTWFPISLLGILGKNNREWNHTIHSRSVKIKDLEKAN
ncbi:glycosyltransferase family 2 protein [Clostridium luticellarii]|uniref:glycosyltransferase family 2 protein n=1 Tax=Clostridium luticellarii TaxID=1691940 RepID=UPI0023555BA8|nr:glycosyltransferase family 2 protein [Clostridium luticellarii]MCI1943826.1 glycosyltransferase [Clostridium luticellarii]MCI1967087.1 glycosyltransferase [Clostridium luticellarii]MCI1994454.1 glycosyltransferase [Clostridium luticellarii]MCI2038593.1 glycosyltransferase [Clostridium luticellarii]